MTLTFGLMHFLNLDHGSGQVWHSGIFCMHSGTVTPALSHDQDLKNASDQKLMS